MSGRVAQWVMCLATDACLTADSGVASSILVRSKAMMFVKLYFRTSDIYLISLVSLDPSGFHLRTK